MAEETTTQSARVAQAYKKVGGREFFVSKIDYWQEGERWVIRSSEFDCIAEGENLNEAATRFNEAVIAYAEILQEAEQQGTASEHEVRLSRMLSDRLLKIFLEERRAPRRTSFLPGRRSGGGSTVPA